jgi:hypothetical protein
MKPALIALDEKLKEISDPKLAKETRDLLWQSVAWVRALLESHTCNYKIGHPLVKEPCPICIAIGDELERTAYGRECCDTRNSYAEAQAIRKIVAELRANPAVIKDDNGR